MSTMLTIDDALARGRPKRSPVRIAAAGGLLALVAFALLGPLSWSDPISQDLTRYFEPPTVTEPLGRDEFGRSVLARLAHATRLSLLLAAASVVTALVLGTLAGVLAAWRGGWIDAVLRGISESFVAMPALLIVLLFAALSPSGSLITLYIGLALAQWVEYFRVVRSRCAVLLGSSAVEAAEMLDLGTAHVVRRHLWPELRPVLTTLASLGMVTAILAMSTLGFIKVGLEPPRAELGLMIAEAFPHYAAAPWIALAPICVLFALALCLFGLRSSEDSR
ncbi:ABC transporter permease [Lolliginicoccus levis]|uniref:ABC transporter permease n=1 Tax=Lolliginicoccus levis TaxID=2919542 RepID=UPI00241C406C|nr:ABC transporter permease [Lolliginicoccus levis]